MSEQDKRTVSITEGPEVPWLGIVLGYGPMLCMAAGAVAAWLAGGLVRAETIRLTTLYAASILAFLAGVRRGISFRTEGGPTIAQLATMLGLYLAALIALVAVAYGHVLSALAILTTGYVAIMALDPLAARRRQAPLFFARLRPTQTLVAVLSLLMLVANVLTRS